MQNSIHYNLSIWNRITSSNPFYHTDIPPNIWNPLLEVICSIAALASRALYAVYNFIRYCCALIKRHFIELKNSIDFRVVDIKIGNFFCINIYNNSRQFRAKAEVST